MKPGKLRSQQYDVLGRTSCYTKDRPSKRPRMLQIVHYYLACSSGGTAAARAPSSCAETNADPNLPTVFFVGEKTWRNSSQGGDDSRGAGVYAARSSGGLSESFPVESAFTMAGVVQQRSLVNALYSAAAFGLTSWRCAKSPNLLTLLPMQIAILAVAVSLGTSRKPHADKLSFLGKVVARIALAVALLPHTSSDATAHFEANK
eukprot:3637-Heterococcus_DN1.PRE.1